MKLWKPSTASSSQNSPFISAQNAASLLGLVAGEAAGVSGVWISGVSSVIISVVKICLASNYCSCFDNHKGLRPRVIVGKRQMNMRFIPAWNHRVEPCFCAAGQRERWRA